MEFLSPWATEGSDYFVDIAFLDEDGAAVVPSAASWTFSKGDGSIVNERENVAIAELASSKTVHLLPADVRVDEEEIDVATRTFTLKFVYTSALGSGLTRYQEVGIKIIPLATVAPPSE